MVARWKAKVSTSIRVRCSTAKRIRPDDLLEENED